MCVGADAVRGDVAGGGRFTQVDRLWRKTLASAKSKSHVISFSASEQLLKDFRESNKVRPHS